jgi:hypothetical protein
MDKTVFGEIVDKQGKTVKLTSATTGDPLAWLTCSDGLSPLLTVENAKELIIALKVFISNV